MNCYGGGMCTASRNGGHAFSSEHYSYLLQRHISTLSPWLRNQTKVYPLLHGSTRDAMHVRTNPEAVVHLASPAWIRLHLHEVAYITCPHV